MTANLSNIDVSPTAITMEAVRLFVQREISREFEWGFNDCCRTADRWVETATGRSPMSVYGRLHASEEEARAWMNEPGSIAVAVNRVARRAGFTKTANPKAGDVGLVIWQGRMFVAVHTGSGWFSRDEDGVISAPLDAVWKAWGLVPCR